MIVVPGNHDAEFVRPWLKERNPALHVDAAIPLDATPALAQMTSWLAPARVRVHYPGVWLSDRVWATHGHYLDRHLLPEVAYGFARGLLGRLPRDGATPAEYERAGGPSVTRLEALLARWLPRPARRAVRRRGRDPARRHDAGHPPAPARPPAGADRTRRCWEPRCAGRASPRSRASRTGSGCAPTGCIFGHVHRCGPLAGDNPQRWRGPGGSPRIANTGSWVYEPLLVNHVTPPHPYWPGGAIRLADAGDPEPIGLLNHLDAAALHGRPAE